MNRAATIEGTPDSTSTMKVVTRASRPAAVLDQIDRDHKPSGTAMIAATTAWTSVP